MSKKDVQKVCRFALENPLTHEYIAWDKLEEDIRKNAWDVELLEKPHKPWWQKLFKE